MLFTAATTHIHSRRSGLVPGLVLSTLMLTSTGCALFGGGADSPNPSPADESDADLEAGTRADEATEAAPFADAGFELNAAIQIAGNQAPQYVDSLAEKGVSLHFKVYPAASDEAAQPRRLGP